MPEKLHPCQNVPIRMTREQKNPVVVRLTPSGRGAVATLRVEGPDAVDVVQSHFQARSDRRLADCSTDQIVVGRFGGPHGEEVVARRADEEAIELHCHGGPAVVQLLEETLASAGCRCVGWRDWTAGRHNDPIEAATLVALADAPTERCAAILLDQFHGALGRAFHDIQEAIDRDDAASAQEQIDLLRSRAEMGRHLTRPWNVVLAGRPNVGKSSLLNALAGHRRAIVHHTPGTTRDALTLTTAIDGWPVELCDTAGLRASDDTIERAGIERARERLARADLIVLISDLSVPWSAEDQSLLDEWPEAVLVHNKCDLPAAEGNRPQGLWISAARGDGIDDLLAAMAQRLVPQPPPPGAAVPFTEEQMAWIEARVT